MKNITDLINKKENFLNLPDISELPDDIYCAKWYGHCFELNSGEKYFTSVGVLSPECVAFDYFDVKNGNITKKYPNILTLPGGVYKARWWCYLFELEDGRIYKTNTGIKCSQRQARWKEYHVLKGVPLLPEQIEYYIKHQLKND